MPKYTITPNRRRFDEKDRLKAGKKINTFYLLRHGCLQDVPVKQGSRKGCRVRVIRMVLCISLHLLEFRCMCRGVVI